VCAKDKLPAEKARWGSERQADEEDKKEDEDEAEEEEKRARNGTSRWLVAAKTV
jgi:hypothetical protein